MISEMAVSEIEALEAKGLKPTIRDIIRLNALGLKIERNSTCGDCYALPRVSYLGDLVFREPALAHLEWIDRVLSYASGDYESQLVIFAYAISRHPDELPDFTKRRDCIAAIKRFLKHDLRLFTREQVNAAVIYAIHGSDAVAREFPPTSEDDGNNKNIILPDELRSVGAGVLVETLAIGLGISVREISQMTVFRARLLAEIAIRRASSDRVKHAVESAEADFFAALSEIERRLTPTTSEKDSNNG